MIAILDEESVTYKMTESFTACVETLTNCSKMYHTVLGNNPGFLKDAGIENFKPSPLHKETVMQELETILASKFDNRYSESEEKRDAAFQKVQEDSDLDPRRTLHAETVEVMLKGEENC